MRSEAQIFNLDSNEFGSNPPFKKRPAITICNQLLAGTEVKKMVGNVSLLSGGNWSLNKKTKFENQELFINFKNS